MTKGPEAFTKDVHRLRVAKQNIVDRRLKPYIEYNAQCRPCAVCRNLVHPDKLDVHNRAFHP